MKLRVPANGRRLAASLCISALALIAACSSGYPAGTALLIADGSDSSGNVDLTIGQKLVVRYVPIQVTGHDRVHLISATVLNVPTGLVVDHVWVRFGLSGGVVSTAANAYVDRLRGMGILHEVNTVTLDPACPPASECESGPKGTPPYQSWGFMTMVHIVKSGHYETGGLRVVYEVNGQRFEQTYHSDITAQSYDDPYGRPSALPSPPE